MLPTRPVCCGSLFLSGFMIWQASIRQNAGDRTPAQAGTTGTQGNDGNSPFNIYRNALNFAMSGSALDEEAAAEAIRNYWQS